MTKRYPPISAKLPVFMHGADYNPDQWLHAPEVLKEDVRLMKLSHSNVMALGIFAWAALEPEEGVFTFEWLDKTLDEFAANGLYAWLATPSGARPAWMSQKYPEVLRVGANRVRNLHGARHNHCYTSPVYREKVAIMNGKLAERYAHHPAVVGWHISNEFGGECHCDYCQDAFREWLKRKYGTLEALNHAWWNAFWAHTITDWSQIQSPAPHGEMAVHGMNVDWRRFVTDQTIDFYRWEEAPLKAANPALPATANMMDLFDGLDYWKFAEAVDVVSWDAYPTWHAEASEAQVASWFAFNHDLFRSLKGKPFMLMESTPSLTNWQPVSKLKRPGMHKLSSMQAIAHGSDTVQYFQWRKSRGSSEKFHGAVVDHVGHEHTRVFRDVTEVGETLEKLSSDVLGAGTDARVAIVFDWDNRWAIRDAQGPRNMGVHYEQTVVQHYRAFWELGISVDVVSRHADLSAYKLVVAPMMYMLDDAAGRKFEAYVEAGGTLVTTYWSGIVDENDLCHLGGFPGPLRKTLGLWSEELEGLHPHDANGFVYDGAAYESHELCDLIHSEGAEVLATYESDFYAGRPALTVNRFGRGKAYYLATRAKEPFYERFYAKLAAEAGVKRVLGTELPAGVTAQARTDGENEYVFVMNFSGAPQTVALDAHAYVDLETGASVTGELALPTNGIRMLKR
ncbi:beta-galactosidase [Paenibacillus antri]|uniref:Beta-galactosidase n=1 Tax=Paenibacillus antri TaxID=2582848 RepID=A0A5R9GF10_9BACL|nr:beta-galactosidase [Paenibacillus antri]TLS51263.1 beta-galactosidase [Paenibacillus antri]